MSPSEMIAELISLGLSQQAIADKVGCSQPTVCRIQKGADPGYKLGRRIESFYLANKPSAAAA